MASQSFGGDWTDQKLQILDEYLAAYCRIFESNLAARHFQTVYVDAFAGGGLIQSPAAGDANLFEEFSEADTAGFLEGSVARALRHAFDRFIFIEKSDARIAELQMLRAESMMKDRIAIRQGDANERLESFASATDWKKTRAVVFLDPYGMQVDWKTIAMLGETKAVDLWLLFPLGQAVMRYCKSEPNRRPNGNAPWIEFSGHTIGMSASIEPKRSRASSNNLPRRTGWPILPPSRHS